MKETQKMVMTMLTNYNILYNVENKQFKKKSKNNMKSIGKRQF